MNKCAPTEKRLYFAALPNLHELKVYRAEYNSDQSIIGIQPPICRELIFTCTEVLVSPTFDKKSNLFIIANKLFAESKEFLTKLENLNVQLCTQIEVDAEIFEYCFLYTLYQRLAPLWNKTSSFLVKGRDFLQNCQKVPAVGLEVFVTDKICLALEPFLVKMPPVQIEDFSIDFKTLWNFKRDKQCVITSTSIEDVQCYVLPSFRKCHVVSVTHSIPKNTPFQNYEELKRHWKLTYGYRVPQQDCHLYFNVQFPGSTTFTYPEWCIRRTEPIRFVRCDQAQICRLFLEDLHSRMSNLFTKPLTFTSDPMYWKFGLPTAVAGKKSFLAKQPQSSTQKCFQTNLPKPHYSDGFEYINKSPESDQLCPQNSRQYLSNDVQMYPECNIPIEKDVKNTIYQTRDINTQLSPIRQRQFYMKTDRFENIIEVPDSPVLEQIVPDDTALISDTVQTHCLNRQKIPYGDKSHKEFQTVPNYPFLNENLFPDDDDDFLMFEPQETVNIKKISNTCELQYNGGKSLNKKQQGDSTEVNSLQRKRIVQHTEKRIESELVPPIKGLKKASCISSSGRLIPQFSRKFKKEGKHVLNSIPTKDATNHNVFAPPKPFPSVFSAKNRTKKVKMQSHEGCDLAMEILSATLNDRVESANSVTLKPQSESGISIQPASSSMKKLKPKRKLQDHDIEDMARKKNLARTNLSTLKHWMKEKKVNFNSRDKKEVLIRKIEEYFGIESV